MGVLELAVVEVAVVVDGDEVEEVDAGAAMVDTVVSVVESETAESPEDPHATASDTANSSTDQAVRADRSC